jgi:hypothetical protein
MNDLASKILFFTEGSIYSKHVLSNETFDLLAKFGLLSTDGTSVKLKFIGLLLINGQFIVVFPKTWSINSYSVKEVPTLILAILKYQKYVQSGVSKDNDISDLGLVSNKLKSALWLLFDYIDNGIIRRSIEVLENGDFSRTSWNRTVKKTNPWFTRSGPIYLKPIQKTVVNDILNEVTIIHHVIIHWMKSTK